MTTITILAMKCCVIYCRHMLFFQMTVVIRQKANFTPAGAKKHGGSFLSARMYNAYIAHRNYLYNMSILCLCMADAIVC
jgi:hypothetical protein